MDANGDAESNYTVVALKTDHDDPHNFSLQGIGNFTVVDNFIVSLQYIKNSTFNNDW